MSTPANDLVPSVSPSNTGRDSVSRLSRATPELMNVSPLCGNTPETESQQKSVQELLQQRQWLHSQRNQLKSQIDAIESESARKLDTLPADELRKLYEQLKEDLLQRTAVHDGREMILKGECLNRVTLSVIQCELSDQCDLKALNRKRDLENILEEYTTLASQVAKQHKENVQLKDGLERVKTENFALLRKSRELYTEIGDKKSAKEEELKTLTTDSKGKSIHEQLRSKLELGFILNNTLQGLILGSGINWAHDELLQALMLDAGKHMHV